jgi:hypothetical protein
LSFLALMALVQGVVTWLYIPETKNMPLEEIEQYWTLPKRAKPVEHI